jgi:hypothetical protein
MGVHLRTWKQKLRPSSGSDPLATLRRALSPITNVEQDLHTRKQKKPGRLPPRRVPSIQ